MNVIEIKPYLQDGKKCRRKNWGKYYIKLVKGCYFEDSDGRIAKLNAYDVLADNWEVVE